MIGTMPLRARARPRTAALAVCLLLAVTMSACRGDASRAQRDGADTASWALGSPSVRVGDGAGQELDRVFGGFLRSDGSMVIGNSGTAELRFYDPAGRLASAAGRSGAGPGEFGSINWIAELPGDSLLAFDMRHQRFSVWNAAGRFARTFTSQAPPGPVRPIGVFGDGSVLLVREGQYDPRRGPGVVRDSMRLLRMALDGEIAQEVGSFAGAEWLLYEHPTSFRATQLPFGRSGHLAVVGDGFVYGSSESGRLSIHDRAGRQVRTIGLDAPPRRISQEEISSVLAEIQDAPERSALARHYGRGTETNAPVFTALRGDREGNLWIRLFPPAGADSVKWVVLTQRGEQAGSVRMHVGWLPLDVGSAGVLVRESDADGVQRVSVRRVLK